MPNETVGRRVTVEYLDEDGLPEPADSRGEDFICCLCGEPFYGYGHNPDPLPAVFDSEEACDSCNWEKVLPARVRGGSGLNNLA